MNKSFDDNDLEFRPGVTIDFGEKYAQSDIFDKVFREGMDLVEETASYLDGPGRADSKTLDRSASLSYASESMRLTTRLMQLASWLLLQRALKDGEMSLDEVLDEKYRIKLEDLGNGTSQEKDALPEGLTDLVARSLRLHERVLRLDMMLRTKTSARTASSNALNDQRSQLEAAFGPPPVRAKT